MMLKSSPFAQKAVESAMERIKAGDSDPKPVKTTVPRDVLYPGTSYEEAMRMQKAGHGFGNYSGQPRRWNKSEGGKINLKDCSVSTHDKNSKHKDCW
jgi:hypothetical protein